MIISDSSIRVWLYQKPTDMRKSFNGLTALVKHVLKEDPLSGHLFAFVNRRRDQMKVLYYAPGGLCVWSKKLSKGRFCFDHSGTNKRAITLSQLQWIIEGIEARQIVQRKRFNFDSQSNEYRVL